MGQERNQGSAGLRNRDSTPTPKASLTLGEAPGDLEPTPSEGRGSEQVCQAPVSATDREAATRWTPGSPSRAGGQPQACRDAAGTTRQALGFGPARRSTQPAATQQPQSEPRVLSPTVQPGTPRQATSTRPQAGARGKLRTHRAVDAMFTGR